MCITTRCAKTSAIENVGFNVLSWIICATDVSHASLMRARQFFIRGLQYTVAYEIMWLAVHNLGQNKDPSRSLGQLKSIVRDDDKYPSVSSVRYALRRRNNSKVSIPLEDPEMWHLADQMDLFITCHVDRCCDN